MMENPIQIPNRSHAIVIGNREITNQMRQEAALSNAAAFLLKNFEI